MRNWGLKKFDTVNVAKKGRSIDSLKVWLGKKERVDVVPSEDLYLTVPKRKKQTITANVEYNGPIDAPIQKVHENVYFPDKGADAPHYKGLIDQWTSDKETISEETIKYAMKKMFPLYTQYKFRFGEVPEAWENLDDYAN